MNQFVAAHSWVSLLPTADDPAAFACMANVRIGFADESIGDAGLVAADVVFFVNPEGIDALIGNLMATRADMNAMRKRLQAAGIAVVNGEDDSDPDDEGEAADAP